MKQACFVAGVACILVYAAVRVLTLDGAEPAWAATLRPVALIAALVCLMLARRAKFTRADLQQIYAQRARASLFIGLVCLLGLPLALWLIYVRYYGALIGAGHSGD